MNDCLNKHCKDIQDKHKEELIIEVAKMISAIKTFKTMDDIHKYYKKHAKFQNKKVTKDLKTCSIKYCNKFNKFQQTEIKKNINIMLNIINTNVKSKPPYYDDLINSINKITSQTNPKEDDIFKLTYYIFILTFMLN